MKTMCRLTLGSVVACAVLIANAYSTATVNGITWKYEIIQGGASLYCECTGSSTYYYYPAIPTTTKGAVSIPTTLGGYSVKSIGNYAFYNCTNITSVIIPNSVTNIGSYAFSSCSGLTSVTIPDSVTSIGGSAFSGCSGLEEITLPFVGGIRGNEGTAASVFGYIFGTSSYVGATRTCQVFSTYAYGNSYFYIPSALKTVVVTDETVLGYGAFCGCNGLTSVTIPDSVTRIGDSAFSGCSGIMNVTIGNGVRSIGRDAFRGCSEQTAVHITDLAAWCRVSFDTRTCNPLYYAHNLYLNGSMVKDLKIPDGVTRIGASAFCNCSGLTSVTIPDSVTSIGGSAFSGCSGITSVTIGNGVTSIGNGAFDGCSEQTAVHITDLAAWCRVSFDYVTGNPLCYAHNLYLNESLVKDLKIPDSVTNIGSYAFYRCSGLTSVTIPDSVTSIGTAAFFSCSGLTSVTIPDSVTSIGEDAFRGCSGLTSVTMPSRWPLSSVFSNSYTTITSVVIQPGSDHVVPSAFKGCTALTNVTVPDTVTSIGDEAFYNCSSLQQLTLPDGVTSYGVNCFEGCPAYTRALYRALFSGSSGGGSPVVVTTIVQQVEAPYALSNTAADRAIASVVVSSDCSIGSFVLKDGKVYDTMLYVSNTADHEVSLSLPSGYAYKTIKGATTLTIPASSQCIISITRVDANTFLVMLEELDDVK